MDTNAKQQYMKTLREEYLKASKRGKTAILNEYCKRTKEERKYAIKKFRYKVKLKNPEDRKHRPNMYKGDVIAALVDMWGIFDHPCGQRLKTLLEDETDKLRRLGEIKCSNEVARQLKTISSATIDRRLTHQKEVLSLNFKYLKKRDMTLLSLVPTKTSVELDRQQSGNIQVDCVEHCGVSASGEYVNSLTTVDILFGWWEGEALMGKGQERALDGIEKCRERFPTEWREMHPDNGTNILNWHIYKYAQDTKTELSRSRAYKKNDNCFVEQKNSTHVRKPFGYLRFDSVEEQKIMNDLYRNELRLFKNFFQPVMKLEKKIRVKGKIHRKYDVPKTPYKRILESDQVSAEVKEKLKEVYDGLNPAELKRQIDIKVKQLYEVYRRKNGSKIIGADKKLTASMVSYYMIKQM